MSSTKRAALYVRVSTDVQTLEYQIRELRQVAERRGWDVVEVYRDAGISGAKGRNGRPGLDTMLKDASRGNPGGSLEATRRSFNKDFLLALAADFKKHGAAAIEKVRKQQPAAYMKICAHLVPREMQEGEAEVVPSLPAP